MTRVTSVSHTLAMAYVPDVFDTPSAVCWLAHWDLLTPTTFVISVGVEESRSQRSKASQQAECGRGPSTTAQSATNGARLSPRPPLDPLVLAFSIGQAQDRPFAVASEGGNLG